LITSILIDIDNFFNKDVIMSSLLKKLSISIKIHVNNHAVIGCKLKQNVDEGCNSCASLAGLVLSFIACFILLVIAPED